ncbi:MAG: hypothetical protein MI864_11490, partial [Pseudomonadales bacterium]|nr:hypothetical protein [Pseudomonadales bacterium]
MATAFFEFQFQSRMAKQGMEAKASAFIGKVRPAGNEGSARTYAIANMKIYIWGDPAQQDQDQQIVKNIRLNTYKSYFGRSWLVYHEIDNRIDAALDRLGLFPIISLWQKGRYLLGSSAQQIRSSGATELSLNPDALGQL